MIEDNVVRNFYRKLGVSYVSARAIEYLEKIKEQWESEYEPYALRMKTLFPWLEVIDPSSDEYEEFVSLVKELRVACKFFTAAEYREKRDQTFEGKEDAWYVVPSVTFSVYYRKAIDGVKEKSPRRYPDYRNFLVEKVKDEKLGEFDSVTPYEFFSDLYTAFTGSKVSKAHEVNLFRCLEYFGIVGPQEAGKKPAYPIIYLRELLNGLYSNPEFLYSLVREPPLFFFD